MKKKVLITGANGFVGGYLTRHLAMRQETVVIAVGGPGFTAASKHSVCNILYDSVDLSDDISVRDLVRRHNPHEVYHLAGVAVTHGVDFSLYHSINALGTHRLGKAILDVCRDECRMLLVSSAGVYGDVPGSRMISESAPVRPKNDYGSSKACAEQLIWPLQAKGLDVRVARPFNHTGPGQRLGFVCSDIIHHLRQAITSAKSLDSVELSIGRLDTVRDFTDVRDVVAAYEHVMQSFVSGEIVNVCSGVGVSIEDLVNMLCYDIAGLQNVRFLLDPGNLGRTELDQIVGDNSLLGKRTGWSPTIDIRTTLREMWGQV